MNQDRVDDPEPHDEFDQSLLSAYLDDELTTEERSRVEERLQSEPALSEMLRDLNRVSSIVKSVSVEPRMSKVIQGEWNILVDNALEGRLTADSKSPKTGQTIETELRDRKMRHYRWMGLAALAASILAIASATFLLPSAFPIQGNQHAKLDNTKESSGIVEQKLDDRPPEFNAMNRGRQSSELQQYSLVTPEELPSATMLIRAKRYVTPPLERPGETKSTSQQLALKLQEKSTETDQEVIEFVVQRAQIASFLADSQLIKLEQKELPADTTDSFFFFDQQAKRRSNRRAIQRYQIANQSLQAEQRKFQAPPADNLPGPAPNEPTNELQAKWLARSDTNSVDSGGIKNETIADERESNLTLEAQMGQERTIEDDWVHVIIEIVP